MFSPIIANFRLYISVFGLLGCSICHHRTNRVLGKAEQVKKLFELKPIKLSHNICFPKRFANPVLSKNSCDIVAEFKIAFETEKEILNCFRFDRVILSRSELGNSITLIFRRLNYQNSISKLITF
jgi:hypothetical protein